MKAIWKNRIIAESDNTLQLEGNHYFPIESVNKEFLEESQTNTFCHWKGTASYYDIKVENEINSDSAWYYADPSPEADKIRGHIAFWRGVEVVE